MGMVEVECLNLHCDAYSATWAEENLPPPAPTPEPFEWDLDYDSLPETPVMGAFSREAQEQVRAAQKYIPPHPDDLRPDSGRGREATGEDPT